MPRFYLFGFDDYYPAGGASDFIKHFKSEQAAKDFVASHNKNTEQWRPKNYEIADENMNILRYLEHYTPEWQTPERQTK